MEEPEIISHLKQMDAQDPESWVFQSNEEHQEGVALLAQQFASAFGCGNMGYVIGRLHDKGKEQHAFQRYIRKFSGYRNSLENVHKTPHAYVGALLAKKLYPKLFPLLSFPIASHHSGLPDGPDLDAKMKEEIPSGIECPIFRFAEKDLLPAKPIDPDNCHHFIRVLFSCLVDADYLDTERFMDKEQNLRRGHHASLSELMPRLEAYLEELSRKSPRTELNDLRARIQAVCREKSEGIPGFYSLTVPTGGGKTLASVLWGIRHAVRYGKDRIIIAIPYTSIIVQTASILRRIFGQESVCEHHSAFDPDETWKDTQDISTLALRQRLASENWDYPIVVTTNVQLFESMFSNRPSTCRKLHNLANSVLILDEVQMLPREYLQPIVGALESYRKLFGTSVLFTTASQPILEGEHRGTNDRVVFHGLGKIEEIIPSDWNLSERLRRVNIRFDDFRSTYDQVAQRLSQYDKVLCIVNTRNDAAELFSRMPDEGLVFHLSRRMCPLHIRETIEQIRKSLNDPAVRILRVISTQLVEAGVDLDFPVVFRQEAGLDSVLQAAGRCNREGKQRMATAYVFDLDKALPRGALSEANEARKSMGQVDDWLSQEAMTLYFRQLYCRCDSFDKKGIVQLLKQGSVRESEINFQQAAEAFKLIEERGRNVIVNYGNSLEYVEAVKRNGFSYDLSRKISRFTINISERDFQELARQGLVEEVVEGVFVLPDRAQYSVRTGLVTRNHWLEEVLIQ